MKRYFGNPELKISSAILGLLIITFMGITSLIMKVHYEGLKADYIKTVGAVTAKVIEKNPELESEIIPIITKEASQEEIQKGEAILSEYSLTKNLENSLFPYIKDTSIKNNYYIVLMFILMGIIFISLNYFQYAFFYKKIRSLTLGARRVTEGDYDININENNEGDLSKLAVSFNLMKEVITSNINKLKDEKQFLVELLSDISHQLKTPLAAMIIYNDIMLSKELSREQNETFLINNKNQLNRMEWLIKQILKLAKLDARAIMLNKENQSLNETIRESIDIFQDRAGEKSINISFNADEEVYLYHDRLWMEEALNNIIKNGIEHNKEGGEITVEINASPIYTKIMISDNGEGIREEDLPNIFKRFYKARTSKKSDSIGIGLALSKSILQLHNGEIEVQSKIGEGTKFTITFLKY